MSPVTLLRALRERFPDDTLEDFDSISLRDVFAELESDIVEAQLSRGRKKGGE